MASGATLARVNANARNHSMMRLIVAIGIFLTAAYLHYGLPVGDIVASQLRPTAEAVPVAGRAGIVPADQHAPIESQLEPGRINVFVFSGRWCPACRRLERNIKRFAGVRPDVAFKFLETNDRWRAQYNIRTVPHVVMFDVSGNRIAADFGEDKSAYQSLYGWMGDETERVHSGRRG